MENKKTWIRGLYEIIALEDISYFKLESRNCDEYPQKIMAVCNNGKEFLITPTSLADLKKDFLAALNYFREVSND